MFNKQQPDTNYTLMVSKVSNGYVLSLLNDDGETVRTAVASSYALRDYASHSFCSAVEELWDYADKLDKLDKLATPLVPKIAVSVAEAHESDL